MAFMAQSEITVKRISFNSVRAPGLDIYYCWNAMGIDTLDNVYCVFGDGALSAGANGYEDCALYMYDSQNDRTKYIGRYSQTAAAAGNAGPNQYWGQKERFCKGHTHIPFFMGKMYMGSMGFHDINRLREMNDTINQRGSHIFRYDIAKAKFEDISVTQPLGVFQSHQGIENMAIMPWYGLIVGYSTPHGDVILYNPQTTKTEIVPGIPSEFGNSIPRDILVTKYGKIYFSYSAPPNTNDGTANVYEYDVTTKVTKKTPYTTGPGFWNGSTWTRDGEILYFSLFNGKLYKITTRTGVIEAIGGFPGMTLGIVLSIDEKKIYALPGGSTMNLYEFDIATGKTILLKSFGSMLSYAGGSHIRDSKGRIYFVHHSETVANQSELLQFDVRDRIDPNWKPPIGTREDIPEDRTCKSYMNIATMQDGNDLMVSLPWKGVARIVLTDIQGRHICSFEMDPHKGWQRVPVSKFFTGTYVVSVKNQAVIGIKR